MNNENTKIEQSLQDALDYFDRLYITNPAQNMKDAFSGALKARLAKVIDGHAKGYTKSSVVNFVTRFGKDCVDLVAPEMEGAFRETMNALSRMKRYAQEIIAAQDKIDQMNEEVYILEETINQRKEQIAALEEEFPDPRARSAYKLYERISEPEPREDAYTKQRRITSAGLVAASYLGLQRYEINPAKQPKQE